LADVGFTQLIEVGGFRLSRLPSGVQRGSSYVELAYVLFKLPGVNVQAGDDGIVFLIPDRTVGSVKSAVGEPELKANADLQLELVLELGVEPTVIAELDPLAKVHRVVAIGILDWRSCLRRFLRLTGFLKRLVILLLRNHALLQQQVERRIRRGCRDRHTKEPGSHDERRNR